MATSRSDLFDKLGNSVDPSDDRKMTKGSSATWSAGVPFERAAAVPLEKFSLFPTLEAAQTYASKNPVAYPGQIVAVVAAPATGETVGKVTAYVIQQDGTLKEVGSGGGGEGPYIPYSDLQTEITEEEKPVSSKAVHDTLGTINALLDELNGTSDSDDGE